MSNEHLSIGARAALGEHVCRLLLRPVGDIPGGLWSWSVYVDAGITGTGCDRVKADEAKPLV